MSERTEVITPRGNREILDPSYGIRLVISPLCKRHGAMFVGLALLCAKGGGHRHAVYTTLGVN